MTTLRTAAQQALEALQKIYLAPEHDEYIRVWWPACDEAITALRAALETQSTHSTDCYKWHHECAIAEVKRLRQQEQVKRIDPIPPPEAQTEAEKVAYCAGWWAALENARKEPPKQEPVAWMVYTLDGVDVFVTANPKDFTDQHRALALYPSPVYRKPLTEEEIIDAVRGADLDWAYGWTLEEERNNRFVAFTRAIEKAHGIGGSDE